MIIIIFGIYTLFLALVWWFFIIAKIHAYKFKDFSTNIEKMTKLLAIILLVISILWYIIIYNFKWTLYTVKIDDINSDNVKEESF